MTYLKLVQGVEGVDAWNTAIFETKQQRAVVVGSVAWWLAD